MRRLFLRADGIPRLWVMPGLPIVVLVVTVIVFLVLHEVS